MLWDDCTSNATVIARRGCFDRAGLFDESLATNEDWDMRVRMAGAIVLRLWTAFWRAPAFTAAIQRLPRRPVRGLSGFAPAGAG
jgi:hypothetical protein